jgi:hypothetical protein
MRPGERVPATWLSTSIPFRLTLLGVADRPVHGNRSVLEDGCDDSANAADLAEDAGELKGVVALFAAVEANDDRPALLTGWFRLGRGCLGLWHFSFSLSPFCFR